MAERTIWGNLAADPTTQRAGKASVTKFRVVENTGSARQVLRQIGYVTLARRCQDDSALCRDDWRSSRGHSGVNWAAFMRRTDREHHRQLLARMSQSAANPGHRWLLWAASFAAR
jgi:hypothetical protein